MQRIILISYFFLLHSIGHSAPANGLYQVDMIVFSHHQSPLQHTDFDAIPSIAANIQNTIPLQANAVHANAPYHLLASNHSQLNNEYWALSHKAGYHIIAHYSWLQPRNNNKSVTIPPTTHNGWRVEGIVQVKQSNYYIFNTELFFSAPDFVAKKNEATHFTLSQNLRLKPKTVYYLDHPQVGMLVKVHKIA